jgi:antirestriction protein ArdC
MSRTRSTPEERQAKLDAAHQQLADAVAALTSSDDWCRYLEVMSRFHTYSATNCLMIAMQRPEATRVAGFRAWTTFGRQVRKGSKGIAIWAPVTRKVDQAEGTEHDPSDPRRCVGFRLTYVFDVADTDGDLLPTSPAPARLLAGAAPEGMWDALAAQVHAAGYQLELVDTIAHSPGANGTTSPLEHVVQIATSDRSPASMAKTLSHELAHVLLHAAALQAGTLERARAEVEAESTAYLVCSAFGLDSMDYTLGYVATWSGGDATQVLATAVTVQRCARAILEAAGPPAADTDSELILSTLSAEVPS